MTKVTHVAIVADEAEIRDSIAEYLVIHGFKVSKADGGDAFHRLFSTNTDVDLVILDIRIPGEDGLSLARWLHEHAKVGVIMLTGSGETVDRATEIEVDADDCIPKPFDLREVLARVRSVLAGLAARPTKLTMPDQVRFGRFILDLGAKRLSTAGGEEIALTSMEFDLLKVFATYPHRVLTRNQLLDLAHGRGAEPFDRSIDIRVTRLRRKIESVPDHPEVIKTVRGAGYMFVPDETNEI